MWRQCHALIHGSPTAPSRLWTVARDLWVLNLSKLTHRLDDRVKKTAVEAGPDTISDAATAGLEQNKSEETQKRSLEPMLWDTISLVYLAALLIRYPISLSRIYSLIRSEELPFIRAIRFVPYEITSHLPSEYQLALDTLSIPQRPDLQKAVYHFIQSATLTFDMEIPALNWKILLYEWTVELGLPLEIYNIVKSLYNILDYDFTYHLQHTRPLQSGQADSRRIRRTPVAVPEFQLISLIVIATKLLYPFPLLFTSEAAPQDDVSNLSSEALRCNSLTDLSLNWSTWHSCHKSHTPPKPPAQKHIETTDRDVSNMSSEEMDQYMTWYQSTFSTPDTILRQKKTDLEMSILDMFPVRALPTQTTTATAVESTSSAVMEEEAKTSLCKQIQSTALSYNPTTEYSREHNRPRYPIFPSVDALYVTDSFFNGRDNNPIVFFHDLAAKIACTDLKGLLAAVRYTEGKMERWVQERYREQVARDGEEAGEERREGEGEGEDDGDGDGGDQEMESPDEHGSV